MSDIMKPRSFKNMLNRILSEYKKYNSIYNVKKIPVFDGNKFLDIFGEKLESPLGIAAGPHTQLAQNLVACYASGCRFFELKTIQKLFGEDLGIPKPCIRAEDEAYNTEWSSEFHASQASDEYIKGYILIKIIAKEFNLGDPDAFIFNISAGYDYEGVTGEIVDNFINTMMNAENNKTFNECINDALSMVDMFENVDEKFIRNISPKISNSITLSTMHGCPKEEIEKIALHLIENKKINTYVKLNPTLLGYDRVRKILDDCNFDYIKFGKEQFEHDIQFDDAISMIKRLKEVAKSSGVSFGVKLTNTFQTEIHNDELPGNAMYMSGKALYPLSINVAKMISEKMDGSLPISFSGGIDKTNVKDLYDAGVWPITICTVLLKSPGLEAFSNVLNEIKDFDIKDQTTNTKLLIDMADKSTTLMKKTEQARKKYDEHRHYSCTRSDGFRCRVLCTNCVRVCPNRTNEILEIASGKIILHVDALCNECGNCAYPCVEPCLPYKDRITLFSDIESFEDSENQGLYIESLENIHYRWDNKVMNGKLSDIPEVLQEVTRGILENKPYLL